MVERHLTPAQQRQALGGDDLLNVGGDAGGGVRILRQKGHPDAVFALRRQGKVQIRYRLAKESVGHLHQDAGAVPGVRVRAGGAAMPQIDQHLQGFLDDGVRLGALDVSHHADAAGVVFLFGGVQPRLR